MVSRTDAEERATKFFRHCENRYQCTIEQVEELDTHWVLYYSIKSLDDADPMLITRLWLIIDKATSLIYTTRGARTQRIDRERYPGNKDILPCTDVRQFDSP
jgi:hypothetical protein